MRIKPFAVALLAFTASFTAMAGDLTFANAKEQSRLDSTNAAYRDWYQGKMRPAFRPVLQQSLTQCAPRAKGNELTSLGLVFAVKPDGSVGDFYVSRNSNFSRCIEREIRKATFPASPKENFYFGLDLGPAPVKA